MLKKIKNTVNYTIFIIFLQFLFLTCIPIDKVCALKNKQDYARSMVTMEVSSGRILYSKNKDEKLPMASTTKILTAIVAIENCKNLDEVYEIPKEAVGIEGSSIYLRQGERLSIRELLYGLMLRSGNDAAVAIAVLMSGSVENFVGLMNLFCENMNLKNTHIVTVNGLHDDNHYTTASDLAKISCYALKNPVFAEIVSSEEKVISSEFDKMNKCRLLKNKNKLLKMIDGADGVKTGYTKKAGKCFVGSATQKGMQIVCVLLDVKTMFDDCERILTQAFNEYKMVKLFEKGEPLKIQLDYQKTQKSPIIIKEDVFYPLKYEEIAKIYAKFEIYENLDLIKNKEVPIGEVSVYIENNLIFSVKVFTIIIDNNKYFTDYVKRIVKVF